MAKARRKKYKSRSKAFGLEAYFHTPGQDPAKALRWKRVQCEIRDQAGQVFFSMPEVKAPEAWSQLAIEIAAAKYFRKAGVPRSKSETSVDQMISRVTHRISQAGFEQGLLGSKTAAAEYGYELKALLLGQFGFFNSPVWFNYGLYQSYGIQSISKSFRWNRKQNSVEQQQESFQYPQVSACFIQDISDSLESIFELAKNEARLFKFGSGSGTNFSNLRSKYEKLDGGGLSSGLLSFLEVLDRGAGSVKSGGTTRRAAKMVIVDVDHPEIEDFIAWKPREEAKAKALIQAGFGPGFESEAYRSVSGQNSNNAVRVTDGFMTAVEKDQEWSLRFPSSGKPFKKVRARDLWNHIAQAAWSSADPGLQFHDSINAWNTCTESEAIHASNPCSEFMFLDNTACNLASLNLLAFLDVDGKFDFRAFINAIRVFFLAQEILIDDASYPTAIIAENSHNFRPLGIGLTGLGAFLMKKAIAYDSDEGRAWGASLAALMTGTAYQVSAEIAKVQGPFKAFKKNKLSMLRVMRKHQSALKAVDWALLPPELREHCVSAWKSVIEKGQAWGFRNAQASVMAPTGTIGLVLDSETTGIEPEFSLLKRKKLSGGGELQILSSAFVEALKKLGYLDEVIEEVRLYVNLNGELTGHPRIKPEHQNVFATAMQIEPAGHLRMMAALQPFVSGAISKTVNLPKGFTSEQIAELYFSAWKLGLKSVAIYRDGSKLSQPLEAVAKNTNSPQTPWRARPQSRTVPDAGLPKCPDCGAPTELAGGCFRCINCGSVLGCA